MTTASPGSPAALDAAAAPLFGSGGPGDASAERMLATVHALAADRFTGRRVGTPGGRAAAEWLAGRLAELGAVVEVDEFAVSGVRELQATPVLSYRDTLLVHRRDFAEQLTSTELPTPVTGQLATAEARSWRARWLLVPAADQETVSRAEAEDAIGLLVPRGVDDEGWMPKMIAGPPTGLVPILSVRTDLHAELSNGLGEIAGSVPMRTIRTTGRNVYGVFSAPSPGGLSVLLTAHYDGVGDDPEVRLPAAADNASGVAVVLEAARLLAGSLPSGTGLAVALLDGEEAGARGSAHHAPQVAAGTYVVNVDGAAQLGEAAAVEAGGPAEPLLAALDQAGRQTGVPLRAGAMASDNRRYAAAGLPSIGIGMGMPGYQTPAETPDRVEPRTLLAAAALVVATVEHLTKSPVKLGETR
ncbi:M28 family peptidase [Kribbella sp. NPDC023855]|uniref:M28 family metallopeptidase n=1 Tax=Kribbella sp. NPDC023855 TaxID=3154698 RepID=UPI0033D51D56